MGLTSTSSEEVLRRRIHSDLFSSEVSADNSAMDSLASVPSDKKCPTVISVLSSLLKRTVSRNERLPPPPLTQSSLQKFSAFVGVRVPAITIEQYLERIFQYANCSTSCFVVAYAYIDRLVQLQPGFRITSLNVHRILITSVLVSAKFLDDSYYSNAYYARIGGITTQEMNKLEKIFLSLLDYRLQVTVSVFESYCSHLEREVSSGGGYQIEKALQAICSYDGEAKQSHVYNTIVA
ncbi:hypothetical protein KP509_07G089000 [Ceratopteris richardii]|uniref:Cyclin n=1 Tax=Ceratopteris richardii TaxID=49495 RepID=A0A8T2UD06_CERRI|nr:hypothetical protein KP509_07G089000 [Ceratopteris richardii]